jgi:hypothetical protein
VSTIRETVDQVIAPYASSLPDEASRVVAELITALEAREQDIANGLRELAGREGAGTGMVNEMFRQVGLGVRPQPSSGIVSDATQELAKALDEIESQVQRYRRELGL